MQRRFGWQCQQGAIRLESLYPPVRMVQFSGMAYSEGIEIHREGEIEIKVYSPEKTIADCFRYRNVIGIDVAIEALKRCKYEEYRNERYLEICQTVESTKYHETLFGNAAVTRNISESVKSQLKEIANKSGEPFQTVLNRFGIERLLYRISILPATRNYLLKGAQLFNLWYDQPFRPTKDIDFLGFGSNDLEEIRKLFMDLSDLDLCGWVNVRFRYSTGLQNE